VVNQISHFQLSLLFSIKQPGIENIILHMPQSFRNIALALHRSVEIFSQRRWVLSCLQSWSSRFCLSMIRWNLLRAASAWIDGTFLRTTANVILAKSPVLSTHPRRPSFEVTTKRANALHHEISPAFWVLSPVDKEQPAFPR
jgi:hypothetical protein